MEENLSVALYLMFIGMTTVFGVLALIVWSGRLLIRVVNRYSPPDTSALRRPAGDGPAVKEGPSPPQLAAMVAAVGIATGGRGRIIRIEREGIPSTK